MPAPRGGTYQVLCCTWFRAARAFSAPHCPSYSLADMTVTAAAARRRVAVAGRCTGRGRRLARGAVHWRCRAALGLGWCFWARGTGQQVAIGGGVARWWQATKQRCPY